MYCSVLEPLEGLPMCGTNYFDFSLMLSNETIFVLLSCLFRANSNSINQLHPFLPVSHDALQFSNAQTSIILQLVYICCCWLSSLSCAVLWFPEQQITYHFILFSPTVSYKLQLSWFVIFVENNYFKLILITLGAISLIKYIYIFFLTQGQNQSSQPRMIKTNLNLL